MTESQTGGEPQTEDNPPAADRPTDEPTAPATPDTSSQSGDPEGGSGVRPGEQIPPGKPDGEVDTRPNHPGAASSPGRDVHTPPR
ncbi:MAG TPA: hypothetical protein VG708_15190 [Mycobacteriales bacterium]|jgi:hypothetical protein|nr:hypothetical protein [Mycobacteriales bacterium]